MENILFNNIQPTSGLKSIVIFYHRLKPMAIIIIALFRASKNNFYCEITRGFDQAKIMIIQKMTKIFLITIALKNIYYPLTLGV